MMSKSTSVPIAIRCPHKKTCTESTTLCKAFGNTFRRLDVLAQGFCPEVIGGPHAVETTVRFEQAGEPSDEAVVEGADVIVERYFDVPGTISDSNRGDENG